MALTYQFVMVVMMLFYYILNPIYISKWIILRIPCLRNLLIRRYYQIVGKIIMI